MNHRASVPFFLLATTVIFIIALNTSASAGASGKRIRRTIGSAGGFINCLTLVDGSDQQRFCSYDQPLLEAIERVAIRGTETERQRLKCPPGKTFRKQCNDCECKPSGLLACTKDLCAEDFFDANGLPKYW